ncbi:MAG: SGNH/GDSL hydrolase family protein [Treponema sp.]|jgi:lysophospholipase L1-like esterase|nr:SGNH/GDSL hydrolase family protein [Treponema sp.]
MMRILFQGDSITDGNRYQDEERRWDLNHQMGHGYAFMVNGFLGARYPEGRYEFVNRGVSGNTVEDLRARLDRDILDVKPDVLSILIGVNDCLRAVRNNQTDIDADRFGETYRRILGETAAKLPGIRILLCEPFILPVGQVKENYAVWKRMIGRIQGKVRELSAEFHTILVPLQKTFDERCGVREAAYWIWDGIHPAVCGHQVIADKWIDAFLSHGLIR